MESAGLNGAHRPDDSVFDLTRVAWERMAEPQPDGYDAMVALELARQFGYTRAENPGVLTLFDGRVSVTNPSVAFPESCVPAPTDHPNVAGATELIRHWPAAFKQIQLLVESVELWLDREQAEFDAGGSISGPGARGFGTIATTVNSRVGLAEALVRETAYHKLRALGFGEPGGAEQLLTNAADERFAWPAAHDRPVAMSVVLREQMGMTQAATLDIQIVRSGRVAPPDLRLTAESLAMLLPRIEHGLDLIRQHAKASALGKAFLEGLFAWTERVLDDGRRLLDARRIPDGPFVHPLLAPTDPGGSQSAADRPRWRGPLIEHELWGEVLIYAPEIERAATLNASARAIWQRCNGRRSLAAIAEDLAAELGRSAEELLPDVQATIHRLREFGLLEPEPSARASLGPG